MVSSNFEVVEHVSTVLEAETQQKDDLKYDEKADVIVELQGTERRRLHVENWARPFQDTFSKHSISEYAAVIVKFGKFVGPAGIISVAYIDPDNFQTSISSGVQFKFKLLFMVLVSNLIAIFLQVCISFYSSNTVH